MAMNHEMIKDAISFEMDRATIYRILNRFCEDGAVHKVIADDGKQYFAWCKSCTADNHSHDHLHFRCSRCGAVECLDNNIKIELPEGYVFNYLNGVVIGSCNKCK